MESGSEPTPLLDARVNRPTVSTVSSSRSRSLPNEPETIGAFTSISGRMNLKCFRPLAIDIAKHLDGGNTYGGAPEVPLQVISFIDPSDGQIFTSQGIGAGMMTVDQGVIPLLIQP